MFKPKKCFPFSQITGEPSPNVRVHVPRVVVTVHRARTTVHTIIPVVTAMQRAQAIALLFVISYLSLLDRPGYSLILPSSSLPSRSHDETDILNPSYEQV